MSPRTQDTLSRKPGGKGRFDPSEPLHMTTRHAAARHGRPRGSSSINGSVDNDDSRRGSLDEVQPTTAHGLSLPMARHLSAGSDHSATVPNPPFGSGSTGNRFSKPVSSLLTAPTRQIVPQVAQSPSRKRKRTYSPALVTESIDTSTDSGNFLPTTQQNMDAFDELVAVVPGVEFSDRVSAGSSSTRDAEHYMTATRSPEVTPAITPIASEPVSPRSDETDPTPRYSGKHVDLVMADVDVPGDDEELHDIDEDEVQAVMEEIDDGAEAEDDEDQTAAGPRKRLTGRRRADHHDIRIEATMRRQLQLKSAYRSIARALKPLLAEIASKTVEELESNRLDYQQVLEYESERGIQQLLDAALANRKRQLELQVKHNREQLRHRFIGEKAARTNQCKNDVESSREKAVDLVLHDTINMAREIQRARVINREATDDEDEDVVHRPKHTDSRFNRGAPLAKCYESRTRIALEVDRAINDLERRFDMDQMLQNANEEENAEDDVSFTILDTTARDTAEAQRESIRKIDILADAATEVDRLANMPAISNEEAIGLQLLADLASRPSVGAFVRPPAAPRRLAEAFTPKQPQMRPPSSQPALPESEMHHRSTLQTSPVTEQSMDQPWNSVSMPSPQQHSTQLSHSDQIPGNLPVAPSPKGLANFPGLMGILGTPNLYSPHRSSTSPRQNHGQLPQDGIQHRGSPSQGTSRHQRDMSRGLLPGRHSGHHGTEASSPGAQSIDAIGRDQSRRPLTSDSRSRFSMRSDTGDEGEVCNTSRESQSRSELPMPHIQDQSIPRESQQTHKKSEFLMNGSKHTYEGHDSHAKPGTRFDVQAAREQDDTRPSSAILAVQRAAQGASLEQPSREGAIDSQARDSGTCYVRPTRETREEHQARIPPRVSSPGLSTTTDKSGSQDGERGYPGRGKDGKHLKPSKAQRNGLSRKEVRDAKRAAQKRPNHGLPTATEGGGGVMSRFRLNTAEATKPSRVPTGTPQSTHHGPDLPYPPLPSYNQPPPPPFPPSQGPHPPQFYHHDSRHPHRNSLPMVGGPLSWPPPPFGPGYGHPHGLASMGPPSESWREGPPGAMPSHVSGPPPGLSRTPSANSQYGGPAIAPARPDLRYPYGSGPPSGVHPPAFAQQQRHADGSGARRRTHSDAPRNTKWQHYNPSGRK